MNVNSITPLARVQESSLMKSLPPLVFVVEMGVV